MIDHLSGATAAERYELTDDIQVRAIDSDAAQPSYKYVDEPEYPALREFPFLFNLWKVDSRFASVAQKPLLVGYARQLLYFEPGLWRRHCLPSKARRRRPTGASEID